MRDGTVASVLLELSQLLDSFLLEYQRVNGSACKDDNSPRHTERIEQAGTPLAGPGPKPRPGRTESPGGIRWGRKRPAPEPPEPEGTVHRIGNGVTAPRLTHKFEPGYSDEARDLKIEGSVMRGFEVWEDGRAHNFEVLRSVGYGLDEKAIEAVRQWEFEPGKNNGNPVKVQA